MLCGAVQDQERELLQRGYETLQTLEAERIADLLKAGEVAHDHMRAMALVRACLGWVWVEWVVAVCSCAGDSRGCCTHSTLPLWLLCAGALLSTEGQLCPTELRLQWTELPLH